VFPLTKLCLNTWKSGTIFGGFFLDILNFHKSKANKKIILKCYKDTWHGVLKNLLLVSFIFENEDSIVVNPIESTCWTIIFNKFVVQYIRFSPFSKAPHNPKKWTKIYWWEILEGLHLIIFKATKVNIMVPPFEVYFT
jgi:hypothetical protein